MKTSVKYSIVFFILCINLFTTQAFSEEYLWEKRVYLATFPRSGNHWARALIEEASHIATGAVYKDAKPVHLDTVFPWGGFSTDHGYIGNCRYPNIGEPVVVKTHYPTNKTPYDLLPSIKIIRIIRHPVDSMYSYYVFLHPNVPKGSPIPLDTLKRYVRKWDKHLNYWDEQKNVVTIYYEDLYNEPEKNLRKIMDATGYKVTDEDIKRAVSMNPPEGGLLKHIENYSKDDLKLINKKLGHQMRKHGYKIPKRLVK
ncbi:MAG: sulfotransferase domain-containing protein [Parachlamydiaceae bacterium]|nr:sulfotransferase domain-containing protein [Parachlamydiaceae bacterium]